MIMLFVSWGTNVESIWVSLIKLQWELHSENTLNEELDSISLKIWKVLKLLSNPHSDTFGLMGMGENI